MTAEPQLRALVADDEEGIRYVLAQLLMQQNCECDLAEDGRQALEKARARPYDIYILDIKMPEVDGLTVLRRLRQFQPDAIVVMVSAFGTQKVAYEAFQAGAYDSFSKPFEVDELRVILRRALERQRLFKRLRSLEQRLGEGTTGFCGMIGGGEAMKRVFDLIRRVAGHDITVLINGESGVGKELVAGAVHELGAGPDKPFVKVNCAAIPETLLESELFGHEKGAFTGAVAAKPGKFEVANGGSILLDEIGELPLALQAKLLRVIQEKKVERIGDTRSRHVSARIMTATNRDLQQMVHDRTFREDLFFRINVIPILIPPLRERGEDIPALVQAFIDKYSRRGGKPVMSISAGALRLLENHSWPGNIRELENVIQRAIVLTNGTVIEPEALPAAVLGEGGARTDTFSPPPPGEGEPAPEPDFSNWVSLSDRIERLTDIEEKRTIIAALRKIGNHRQATADFLGISRKSLHNKMLKHGLMGEKEKFDTSA